MENAQIIGTEYWYDPNGNMRKDINKHIDSIRYNLLNLPEGIIFENGNRIKYYYDATGTKWRKEVSGSDTSTTDYVGSLILENDTLKTIQTAEGRIVADTQGYLPLPVLPERPPRQCAGHLRRGAGYDDLDGHDGERAGERGRGGV